MSAEAHEVILLTPAEREIILAQISLPSGLAARFRFAVHQGDLLEVTLSQADLGHLFKQLSTVMMDCEDLDFVKAVAAFTDRNTEWLPEEEEDVEKLLADELPEELVLLIRRLVDSGKFATEEEALEAVHELLLMQDTAPHEDLHGLSPRQLMELVQTQWDDEDTVLTLSGDLGPEDLRGSAMAHNAVRFLAAVGEAEPLRLTVRGNLSGEFLRHVIEILEWPHWDLAGLLHARRPKESSVRPLHHLRVLLELAGFIDNKKGKMTLTDTGRAMLDPARLGALHVALFRAHCGDFNQAYLDRLPDFPDIQETYPVILYYLGQLATENVPLDTLAEAVFLPSVYEEFLEGEDEEEEGFLAAAALKSRVVIPLIDFGLLQPECVVVHGSTIRNLTAVKTTPLFHKMIHFAL